MANLYIADDGTIHNRDVGNCQRVVSGGMSPHVSGHTTPAVSGVRKFVFWIITLFLAVVTGYVVYSTIGITLFELTSNPNDMSEYTMEFLSTIAPYVIIAGAVICAIIYGVKCAPNNAYNLGTYFLSVLSAIGGTVGAIGAMYLLALAITLLMYALLIGLVIGIIVGLLGGE